MVLRSYQMARSKRTSYTLPLLIAAAGLFSMYYFTSVTNANVPSESRLTIKQFAFTPNSVIRLDSEFPITGEGVSGASVTWDFSRLRFSDQEFSFTAQDMATTPGAERFPGATAVFAKALADGSTGYYFFDYKGGFTEHGEMMKSAGSEMFLPYSDPMTHCTTPIAFGRKGTDNFSFSSTDHRMESNTTGIITWNADAYGTLKLPNAIYTDVVRVRTMENEITTEVINGISATTESQTLTWRWFKADYPLPLLTYSRISDDHGLERDMSVAMVSMVGL